MANYLIENIRGPKFHAYVKKYFLLTTNFNRSIDTSLQSYN
jgi:hypothetical protein